MYASLYHNATSFEDDVMKFLKSETVFRRERDEACDCDVYIANFKEDKYTLLMEKTSSAIVTVLIIKNGRDYPLDKQYSDVLSFKTDLNSLNPSFLRANSAEK